MKSKLVIVESPSKSKTIGQYLGEDYIVLSSKGHIRDLAISGVGGLGLDIENNFTPRYEVIKEKKAVVKELKNSLSKIDEVFLATDPDREGEAISWHLREVLEIENIPTKRVIFNEITKEAILKAFSEPRDLDLNLELNQSGIINGDSYEFSGALNSMISCEEIYYVMGKITKVGTSYTFENIAEKSEVTAAPFIGTATVVVDDWADDYIDDEIIIEAGSTPYEFYIRMTTNPYIDNPDTAYLIMTIDPTTGSVTGVSNEPWEYSATNRTPVTAAGSVDLCNKIIDIDLDYWYNMGTHYKGQQLKLQL